MMNKMNIVVIHGQNHKGSTWNVARILLENITGNKEVKEFFLPKDLNHFCLGCYKCLEKRENCPYWEEKKKVNDVMLEADLLIFASPNYCMMPSAPMKAFLDLFYTNWVTHKPYQEMFSKRAVIISTTAGAGAKKATRLLADNIRHWCVPEIKQYGIAVNAMNWPMVPQKKKDKIERDMKRLGMYLSKQKAVHVGLRTKLMFRFYGGMQKANWGASEFEKEYWIEKGWLDAKRPWK